ncbi:hypothetical protein PUN28_002520 [Cardiocondyla obscurior]|uniref:Uncharacterized protein n=1 Tax=Cardiocondyla obscurior TaxID=286306 RepID=A0AAW2GUU1_9HYME
MFSYRGLFQLSAVSISLLSTVLAEISKYQYTSDNDVAVKSSLINLNDKYQVNTPRVVRVYTQDSYPDNLSVPSEVFERLLEPKKLIVLPTREDLHLLTQLYDYPHMFPNAINPQYAIIYMGPKLIGHPRNNDYGYRVYAYKLKPEESLKAWSEKISFARFAPSSRWERSDLPPFIAVSQPTTKIDQNDDFGCISEYGKPPSPCITPPLVFGIMSLRTRTDLPNHHTFVSNMVPKTQQQAWPARDQRYFKEYDGSLNLEESYYPFASQQDSVNDYSGKYRDSQGNKQPSEENMAKLMQLMTSLNFLRPGEYFTRVILPKVPVVTQNRQAEHREEIPLQDDARYRQVVMIQDEPNIEKTSYQDN